MLLSYEGAHDPFHDLLERYATHIVKSFDARDYPELAANEYECELTVGTTDRTSGWPCVSATS